MSKIITISGKGGVGKTTTTALLLDEMARLGYDGRLLVVDGDPAMTLYLALGLPAPAGTLAQVRDESRLDARSLRALPQGMTPFDYLTQQLQQRRVLGRHSLRQMSFDLLAMGWGEGAGCYCSVNNMLGVILTQLLAVYDLVVIDNEAGLEHLARHRISHVDLFVTVATGSRASQLVAKRIAQTARGGGMTLAGTLSICINGPGQQVDSDITVPHEATIDRLLADTGAVTRLADHSPVRTALRPLVLRALTLGGHLPKFLIETGPPKQLAGAA